MDSKKFLPLLMFLFLIPFPSLSLKILIVNETYEFYPSGISDFIVKGDMSEGILDFSLHGYTLGEGKAKVYLIGPASKVLVKDVSVNGKSATVFFDSSGYYFVTEEKEFSATGKIILKGGTSTSIIFPGPVNHLKFELENGYAVGGQEYFGVVNRSVTLQKSLYKHVVISEGFARFTWENDVSFTYRIDITSFGGTIGRYILYLKNGEMISSVSITGEGGSGTENWQVSGNMLILDLPIEKATVIIQGKLSCGECSEITLKNPFSAQAKILLEAEPEKELGISTSAQELDISEAPFTPKYPNGRVFLLYEDDKISISVKELEKLPSLAATVDQTSYKMALTQDGAWLIETNYRYKNSGLDYIEITVPGTPLYAEAAGKILRLTVKNGKLYLAFPKSFYSNSLSFLYFASRSWIKPLDVIELPLPTTQIPQTTATARVYLPQNYYILAVIGGDRIYSEIPSIEFLLVFFVVVGLFALMFTRNRKEIVFYYIISISAYMFSTTLFFFWLGLTAFPYIKRNLPKGFGKTMLKIVLILLGVGAILLAMLGFFSILAGARYAAYESPVYEQKAVRMKEIVPLIEKTSVRIGEKEGGKITVQLKKGVNPVKMEIPTTGKVVTITKTLVSVERPFKAYIIAITSWIKYVIYFFGLFFLYKLFPKIKKVYFESFGYPRN